MIDGQKSRRWRMIDDSGRSLSRLKIGQIVVTALLIVVATYVLVTSTGTWSFRLAALFLSSLCVAVLAVLLPASWRARIGLLAGTFAAAVGVWAVLLQPGPAADDGSVIASQPDAGVKLFETALGANFKTWALNIDEIAAEEGVEFEAPILGAWWSLADWCTLHRRGTQGICYDLAAEYVRKWFDIDPRVINSENWSGAGAVAGLVDAGYKSSQRDLGEPVTDETVFVVFAGRPGVDLLCEPSCAERIQH